MVRTVISVLAVWAIGSLTAEGRNHLPQRPAAGTVPKEDLFISIDLELVGSRHHHRSPIWQSSFQTMIIVGTPLSFKLKSNDGIMMFTITLEHFNNDYLINYVAESVTKSDKEIYIKGQGSTPITIGSPANVNLWPTDRIRSYGHHHSRHNNRNIILSFLIQKKLKK